MKAIISKFLLAASVFMLALPAFAEETWSNVAMVDVACSAKAKANPDAHTRACALQCQKSGFGVLTPDGDFLKLDDAGNAQAIAALKSVKTEDHLRVTVTGTRDGNTIKVKSLKM